MRSGEPGLADVDDVWARSSFARLERRQLADFKHRQSGLVACVRRTHSSHSWTGQQFDGQPGRPFGTDEPAEVHCAQTVGAAISLALGGQH